MTPRSHPRLLAWWRDDPADPGRASLNHPDIQRLVAAIAPDAHASDLGGVMSLNVRLDPAGLVLRVHQPFVSRQRLLALQAVRQGLANQGLIVPVPVRWRNATVLRCGNRWAELEQYIPHERLAPALSAYAWSFGAMGALHRAPESFAWQCVPGLIAEYEAAAGAHLTPLERRALAPYTAAVPLYHAALDGFSDDPVALLRSRLSFLRLGEWLLAHPTALLD